MTTPDLFGAGRGVYAAVNPFAAYRHEGHHLARRALMYLLGLVAPPDRRLVTAWKPLHVEISGHRQGEQLVVHLLNNNQQKPSAASRTSRKSRPCIILPSMCALIARHGASC